MEILLQSLVGLILVPLYNMIKGKLGVSGAAAAWVLIGLTLLIAVPMAIFTGQLEGVVFDFAEPFVFLRAVTQGFLIILGVAEGLYALTKKRGSK